ncbi:MAG: T9SS type A sorting domain-containing protein [Bacteroidales bacterium]|nr:T9SS type A sorting domain-containing protein [Bacteroidales bacterium]
MKKSFSLMILAMAISVAGTSGFGQDRCPSLAANTSGLSESKGIVGDFTITDTQGNVLNLYETLDQGKTVFIDLFFVNCGYCQMYAPIIEQVYQNSGAGQGDILMWGISPDDNNAAIDAYKTQYGISNPCAGTQGNGPAAVNIIIAGQPFLGYPTYCVICPDKNMYFDVCYPPQVNCFNQYFDACAQTVLIAGYSADVTAVCEGGTVTFTDESVGNVVSWQWTFEGGDPAASADQNPVVTYTAPGAYDVELTVSNGSNTNTLLMEDYITVNTLPVVTLGPFEDVCIYEPPFELTGGMPEGGEYSGPGVNGNWFYPENAGIGTHTITYLYTDANDCENIAESTIFVDLCEGIATIKESYISLFPNPAAGFLNIKTGSNGIMEVCIYNAQGSLVYRQENTFNEDKSTFRVNLAGIGNGIYIVEVKSDHAVTRGKISVLR